MAEEPCDRGDRDADGFEIARRQIDDGAALASLEDRHDFCRQELDMPIVEKGLARVQLDEGPMNKGVHTRRGERRYRYYASMALVRSRRAGRQPGSLPRIGVGVIDEFVMAHAAPVLSRGWMGGESPEQRVRASLVRVPMDWRDQRRLIAGG